jgi:uncharacterized membrane protein YdbT with pleckstrin-like domain
MSESTGESTLLEVHPVMFRNSPVLFVLCILSVPLLVGLVALVAWWLFNKSSTLTITNKRTIQRRGLISKYTTEVVHRDVRNIQVSQSIFQRLLGVGKVGISSSGQGGVEIQFSGVQDPDAIKTLIDRHRDL